MPEANYEPKGTRFHSATEGVDMILVTEDEPRKEMRGWLLRKHRDGQWVTFRKATDADLAELNMAVVRAHHSK